MRGRKLLRSPLVAMFAFVTLLGAGGLLYAHWTVDANIQGQVNTAGVAVDWWGQGVGTNDDGDPFNDSSGTDCDPQAVIEPPDWPGEWEDPCPAEEYDANDPWSSADPLGPGARSDRYTKDVANCHAWADQFGLGFNIDNAYPSYWCTIEATLVNTDQVPLMSNGLVVPVAEFYKDTGYWSDSEGGEEWFPPEEWNDQPWDWCDDGEGPYVEGPTGSACNGFDEGDIRLVEVRTDPIALAVFNDSGELHVYHGEDHELSLLVTGDFCGDQLDPIFGTWDDPSDRLDYSISVHVENGADMYTSYYMMLTQQFVNWNEYDPAGCGIVFLDGLD